MQHDVCWVEHWFFSETTGQWISRMLNRQQMLLVLCSPAIEWAKFTGREVNNLIPRVYFLSLFERDLLICRFIHLSLADDVIPIFFSPELQPAVGYGGRHYLGPSDLRLIRTKGGFWARERQAELQRPWRESRRVAGRNTGWQPVAAGGLWEWNQGDGNRHTGATVRKMSPVGEGIHGLLQQRQRHFPQIQTRRKMPSQGIPHWSIAIICLVIDWLIDWLIDWSFYCFSYPRYSRPTRTETPSSILCWVPPLWRGTSASIQQSGIVPSPWGWSSGGAEQVYWATPAFPFISYKVSDPQCSRWLMTSCLR